MKLSRTRHWRKGAAPKRSLQGALLCLGLSPRVVYRNPNRPGPIRRRSHGLAESFWEAPPERLWSMLEVASVNFKYLIRRFHPDMPEGSHFETIRLVQSWQMVRRHFARRGFELA